MTNKPVLALIVSSSGALQNGLLALMTTIPQISAVLVAEDVNAALRMVENHQPALVILDISSLQEQEVIYEIKNQWPHIHLIVLVEDVTQGEEVEESGVDGVLLKGFSAQKLVTIVESVIDCREETPTLEAKTDSAGNVNQIIE